MAGDLESTKGTHNLLVGDTHKMDFFKSSCIIGIKNHGCHFPKIITMQPHDFKDFFSRGHVQILESCRKLRTRIGLPLGRIKKRFFLSLHKLVFNIAFLFSLDF